MGIKIKDIKLYVTFLCVITRPVLSHLHPNPAKLSAYWDSMFFKLSVETLRTNAILE